VPTDPRIVLAGPAKYHLFDAAAELHARGLLAGVVTGYPKYKLRTMGVPMELIVSRPYFHVPYRFFSLLGWKPEHYDNVSFDWLCSRSLPEADVYQAIAGSALRTTREVHRQGKKLLLDRPCSHIRVQNELLRGEFEYCGVPFRGIDPRVIAQEEIEYEEADAITVPSEFAKRSFLKQGFDPGRITVIPYGVSLEKFRPTGERTAGEFVALFAGVASVRKSTPRLIEAFRKIVHPKKRLLLVGGVQPEVRRHVAEAVRAGEAEALGHVSQDKLREVMGRADVLVLPSIEDGYGVVMSQAMACGTPVLASQNTGAEMLLTPEKDGLIVPAGDTDALAAGLQRFADDPEFARAMGQAALETARSMGGWAVYADRIVELARSLLPRP
jgi:starch synthase